MRFELFPDLTLRPGGVRPRGDVDVIAHASVDARFAEPHDAHGKRFGDCTCETLLSLRRGSVEAAQDIVSFDSKFEGVIARLIEQDLEFDTPEIPLPMN